MKRKTIIKIFTAGSIVSTGEENLQFKSRCGEYNIDGDVPKVIPGKGRDLKDSLRKRNACVYGISLDAYHWPIGQKQMI